MLQAVVPVVVFCAEVNFIIGWDVVVCFVVCFVCAVVVVFTVVTFVAVDVVWLSVLSCDAGSRQAQNSTITKPQNIQSHFRSIAYPPFS